MIYHIISSKPKALKDLISKYSLSKINIWNLNLKKKMIKQKLIIN